MINMDIKWTVYDVNTNEINILEYESKLITNYVLRLKSYLLLIQTIYLVNTLYHQFVFIFK